MVHLDFPRIHDSFQDNVLEKIENQYKRLACYGEEGLDDGSSWIACDHCFHWYRKACPAFGLAG